MEEKKITVTSPLLPDMAEFIKSLTDVWDSKWITNGGSFHNKLELELARYLKVPYVSLFTNGTLPLIAALQALNITGEVITTPYSFVATTHALWWNKIKPVFVDIDIKTGNINPDLIEAAITPRTTAIMPVHVYGTPCDINRIQGIADKYNLKVIYDAAHAFGVEQNGDSILNAGDLSTLSFHATKVFNTVEGGAMVMKDLKTKEYIDKLKNFGFQSDVEVIAPGINSKMDEVRSAYGLVNLLQVDDAIMKRKEIAKKFREVLRNIDGISYLDDIPGVRHNYSYFPVFVDFNKYGMTRDELFFKMKSHNIYSRRYFYPLISEFSIYKNLDSSRLDNLPNAKRMSESVICLPMHHKLSNDDINRIINCISK